MINPDIFKRYDVRGKFPEDITEELIEKLVRACVHLFKPSQLIIGHDPLEGSATIYPKVCEEFRKYGVSIYKAGTLSSPMLYWASPFYNIPFAINLTASHLGIGHTGFKILNAGIPPTPEEIIKLRDLVLSPQGLEAPTSPLGAETELTALLGDYEAYLLKLLEEMPNTNRYKIVIDVSNGPNAQILQDLFTKLKLDVILINNIMKAKDLAHDTNPKIEANRKQLLETLISEQADLGIIWDGDGDRAYFLNKDGSVIPPEFVAIQTASYLFRNGSGKSITIDIRASSAVEVELNKIGCNVKRIQAWHIPIKEEMAKDPGIFFGMEASGHYVFRDLYRSDDGLFASLMFVKALLVDGQNLNELLEAFRKTYKTIEEINFRTEKTEEELIKEFKNMYPDAKLNDIDGITIDYPDWRFNVRSSRTEPIIRLNISGTNFTKVDSNLAKIKDTIGGTILP